MKTIFPTRISHYPSGNKTKNAINQRQDYALEYWDNSVSLRRLGAMAYLHPEEAEKVQRTITDAIERYREGIKGVFTDEAFSVVLAAEVFER